MAVDTRDERAGAAHHWLPNPDGTVATLDRRHVARLYPLEVAVAPPDPNPVTLTIRDTGHTGSLRDKDHTATVHDRGHTGTAREQRR